MGRNGNNLTLSSLPSFDSLLRDHPIHTETTSDTQGRVSQEPELSTQHRKDPRVSVSRAQGA